MKFNHPVGTLLVCVESKSCGYKKGERYTVIDQGGTKGLMAGDGYFDPLSQLLSQFVPVSATEQALRLLTKG